mgnify:FL=1
MITMWKSLLKRDLVRQAKDEAIFQTSEVDREGSRNTMARLAEEYAPEEVADWRKQLQEDKDLFTEDDDDEDPFKKAVDVSIDSIFEEAADEILQLVSGGADLRNLSLKSSIIEILDECRKRVNSYLKRGKEPQLEESD